MDCNFNRPKTLAIHLSLSLLALHSCMRLQLVVGVAVTLHQVAVQVELHGVGH
jgi:hypothetical protein